MEQSTSAFSPSASSELGGASLVDLCRDSPQEPSKYIRFIYNRVVLENATVRASAVSALAKFGIQIAELRPSIIVLLQRCLYDNDDEVSARQLARDLSPPASSHVISLRLPLARCLPKVACSLMRSKMTSLLHKPRLLPPPHTTPSTLTTPPTRTLDGHRTGARPRHLLRRHAFWPRERLTHRQH